MPDDPHDLARFVEAQAGEYSQALAEIKAGRKRSHWIWYVFPQIDSLAGKFVLRKLRKQMSPFGAHTRRNKVRVLLHPDQYVVLNSHSEAVCRQSLQIMTDHARQARHSQIAADLTMH